jgi:hypothetical protein
MRHNHFSMLPEQAFQPRPFGGMTLEGGLFGGGGGGGGGDESPKAEPTRSADPRPTAPYVSAGGGFQGRGAPPMSINEDQFNAERYLKQNPDVAADPYYGKNPFHHYQDFGFAQRLSPSENFQYMPSQQPQYNPAYKGSSDQGLVDAAYANILNRQADPEGRAYYQNKMREGLTGQGLVAELTKSPEFQRQREFERAYTETYRPDYKEFGPSGQYYQPIYQSSYKNYQQPSKFYAPSYDLPPAVNPFDYSGAPTKGESKGKGSDSGSK